MSRYNERPYNSVRFICECGRKLVFPASYENGHLRNGAVLYVTDTEKQVHCACGLITFKKRTNFRGE